MLIRFSPKCNDTVRLQIHMFTNSHSCDHLDFVCFEESKLKMTLRKEVSLENTCSIKTQGGRPYSEPALAYLSFALCHQQMAPQIPLQYIDLSSKVKSKHLQTMPGCTDSSRPLESECRQAPLPFQLPDLLSQIHVMTSEPVATTAESNV